MSHDACEEDETRGKIMLIAGIIGHKCKSKTASLINSILSPTGKKVSIIDLHYLIEQGYDRIKSYIKELNNNSVDILILKIELSDAEKEIFDYLHFDIIIYINKADDLDEKELTNKKALMRKVFSLLDQKGIVIVNVDDDDLIKLLEDMKYLNDMKNYIVTYGFNSKASVTTSSVGDMISKDNFMCCLQKTVSAKNGLLIEPQEYVMKVEPFEIDPYDMLAAATFAIINRIDLNSVNSIPPKF
jgi:UDP-N-acetylmuramate-alanine ligase